MMNCEDLKSSLNDLLDNPSKEIFLNEFEPINDWKLSITLHEQEFWNHKKIQILTLQESLIDETMGIFKKGFKSIDWFEAVSWLSSKIEILKLEQRMMKRLGFQQYRNSGFVFENEHLTFDVSREMDVDHPTGVNEISKFIFYYGDMDFVYFSYGDMVDLLKSFIHDKLIMNDYLLFPSQMRDKLIGELA